jgi:preprotein translocase subunit SecD
VTDGQKKKVWLLGFLVLVAVVALAPNLLGKAKSPDDFSSRSADEEGVLPHWWPAGKIKLGLDLKGGTYLVLGVQSQEAVKSQLQQMAGAVKAKMRRKANVRRARAVDERRMEVVLLGSRGLEEVQDYISKEFPDLKAAGEQEDGRQLTLHYLMSEERSNQVRRDAVDQAIETIRNRVDATGVAEPIIQRSGAERIIVQLPDITDIKEVKEIIGSVAKLEFRLAFDPVKSGEIPTIKLKERDGGEIVLEDEVLMTGDAIQRANVEINPQTNEIEVSLRLNSLGASTFDRITKANIQRQLAIVLDGVVQSAPVIQSRISGGMAVITGSFSKDEARRLAIVLRSGALPAPLEFLEERTVGATLGADSINKGFFSMLIGSICVVVFTVFYYRKSGVLAVGCLVLNLAFLLTLLSLLGATLTLPGIAGLILTVGMAVDANVIIFERIREELRSGTSPSAASAAGFLKAHWTILDANITTLLTGIVLYGWGTGPIRGFAVTLCLGIVSSVFCALFVARLGFEILKMRDAKGSLSI